MRKRLNLTHPPLLAAAVRCADPAEAIAAIRSCALHGADMIDLHISCLNQTDDETLARVIVSKTRGKPLNEKDYKRLSDALLRRGFSWGEVKTALRTAGAARPDADDGL